MNSIRDVFTLALSALLAMFVAFMFIMLFGWWFGAKADESDTPQVYVIPPLSHMGGCRVAKNLQIIVKNSNHKVSKVSAPRLVADDRVKMAVEYFDDMSPRGHSEFDEAWLADIQGEGGFLLVGTHGMVCGRVAIPDEKWKPLLALLDGDPA